MPGMGHSPQFQCLEYSTVNKMPQNVAFSEKVLEKWLTLPQIGTIIEAQSREAQRQFPETGQRIKQNVDSTAQPTGLKREAQCER